jgi:hypothetical protein
MKWSIAAVSFIAASCMATMTFAQAPTVLRPPSAFAAIDDQRTRSVALFAEAGKVLQHPLPQLPSRDPPANAGR